MAPTSWMLNNKKSLFLVLSGLFCLVRSLQADLILENHDFRMLMDQKTGTFSLSSLNKGRVIPLLDDLHYPYTSFVGFLKKGKLLTCGGFNGQSFTSKMDANAMSYSWMLGKRQVQQVLRMDASESGTEIVMGWNVSGSQREELSFVCHLDLTDVSVFDMEGNSLEQGRELRSGSQEFLLKQGSKYFKLSSENMPFGRVLLSDWESMQVALTENSGLRSSKEDRSDSSLGLVWPISGIGSSENFTIRLSRFTPPFNPSSVVFRPKTVSEVRAEKTNLVFVLKNGSLNDLENLAVELLTSSGIRIHSSPVYSVGTLERLKTADIDFSLSSTVWMEQVVPFLFKVNYDVEGKKYEQEFRIETVLKKSMEFFEVSAVYATNKIKFEIVQPKNAKADDRTLVIDDMEGTRIRQFPLLPDQTALEWDGKDVRGRELVRGTVYSYGIEAVTVEGKMPVAQNNLVTDPEILETESTILIRFPAVNFGYDNAAIKSFAYPILKRVSNKLKELNVKKVKIVGYTDNTGPKKKNQKLSYDRAVAVADYFIGVEGFSASLFTMIGMADEQPVVPNTSEENRSKNRRVEILIEK